MLWNLLTNAIKFSARGETVTVSLRHDATWLELEVSDTGLGIPPEFLPHVFESFRQAEEGPPEVSGTRVQVVGGRG